MSTDILESDDGTYDEDAIFDANPRSKYNGSPICPEGIPTIPVQWRACDWCWLTELRCPYCPHVHRHTGFGLKRAHCIAPWRGGSYFLRRPKPGEIVDLTLGDEDDPRYPLKPECDPEVRKQNLVKERMSWGLSMSDAHASVYEPVGLPVSTPLEFSSEPPK
jgi:hypothetical protein